MGDRSRENKQYDDAVHYLRSALEVIRSSDYGKVAPGALREMTLYRSLIRAVAEKGDRKQAELLMQVVPERAGAIVRSFSGYHVMERFPPSALMWVGDAYRALSQTEAAQPGDLEKACDAYQMSANAWTDAARRTDIAVWQALISELAAKRRDCEASTKR